jgi:hypothetical protein
MAVILAYGPSGTTGALILDNRLARIAQELSGIEHLVNRHGRSERRQRATQEALGTRRRYPCVVRGKPQAPQGEWKTRRDSIGAPEGP